MHRIILPALAALALSAGGCFGEARYGYGGGVTVTASTPDLVTVGPGVSVIADYDEPIFYSNGYYWWNYGDGWYRSSSYTGGWVYASPPSAVISIRQPYAYRHYRPGHYVARNRPVPIHRIQRPVVRDHRAADRRDRRR